MRRWLIAAGALAPLALLWPAWRQGVESRMLLHMLIELPALFAAGMLARRALRRTAAGRWLELTQRALDGQGWTGALAVSALALFWMIPSALDAALLLPGVAAAKFASCWLVGFMFGGSWRRLEAVALLFFGGSLAWMLATAGLMYIDSPVRLCANYLADDQVRTGTGLLLAAVMLGLATWHRVANGLGTPAGEEAARLRFDETLIPTQD